MNAEAITELERALSLRCRDVLPAACASALRDGRDEVTDDDFENVLKMYQKTKKRYNK